MLEAIVCVPHLRAHSSVVMVSFGWPAVAKARTQVLQPVGRRAGFRLGGTGTCRTIVVGGDLERLVSTVADDALQRSPGTITISWADSPKRN